MGGPPPKKQFKTHSKQHPPGLGLRLYKKHIPNAARSKIINFPPKKNDSINWQKKLLPQGSSHPHVQASLCHYRGTGILKVTIPLPENIARG